MYVLALSDYKQHAAAAGYKPAPQLGRQIAAYFCHNSNFTHTIRYKAEIMERLQMFCLR